MSFLVQMVFPTGKGEALTGHIDWVTNRWV